MATEPISGCLGEMRGCLHEPGAVMVREEASFGYPVPTGKGPCVTLATPDSPLWIDAQPTSMGADHRCKGCSNAGSCEAFQRVVGGSRPT